MGTLHLAVNVRFSFQGSARGLVACSASLLPFFYFLTLAPRDYITYCQARGLAMREWPSVSTRQDMGRTIRGGPAYKIKACTALLGVHRKLLYSTKYDTLLVSLPLPEYIRRGRGPLADGIHQDLSDRIYI